MLFRLSVGFGLIWFVVSKVLVGSVIRNLDLSEKENSKFESAIILNFDQKSESEFYFEKSESEFGIEQLFLKYIPRILETPMTNDDDSRNAVSRGFFKTVCLAYGYQSSVH